MAKTKIEWADVSWNPVTGCTPVGTGCKNCYAARMAKRLQAMGQPKYRNGFKVTFHEHALEETRKYKKPSRIFVCSMSDLFHEDVSSSNLMDILGEMCMNRRHTYLVLTKRPERMSNFKFSGNVHVGISASTQEELDERVQHLLKTVADVKFLSLEPLLGMINIPNEGIDGVIVGGETGPGARPIKPMWVGAIHGKCKRLGIPFFFKHWGRYVDDPELGIVRPSKESQRLLFGREFNELA